MPRQSILSQWSSSLTDQGVASTPSSILGKWQAMFPNSSPVSNPTAVAGKAADNANSLVNYSFSPTREASQLATDSWSDGNAHPIKGDGDILAMWNRTALITNRDIDPEVNFVNGTKEGPLARITLQGARTTEQKIPMSGQNTTRFVTKTSIEEFQQYTQMPSLEDENDVITVAEFS